MDLANGIGEGQDTFVSQPGLTSSASASPAQSAPVQSSDERIFKQSEVNDIVKRAKYGAVEDYRRLQSEQPSYAREKQENVSRDTSQSQRAPSENDIRKLAAEETQRLRDQWVQEARTKSETDSAQRIVQSFFNKIAPGKEKYQDFEKVTGDIEYARFPNTVQLLAEYVDNSSDVLYELGKDRFKMAQLEQLAMLSPKDALVQAQRLSKSIKDNESVANVKVPNEPLSQMRPSNTGTDNSVLSVKDLRAKYRV